MKLTEIDDKAPQFKGEANSIEELLASIKGGRFTLDGRNLIVDGDLLLMNRQLISLAGCPQVVKGHFLCQHNLLKTLEGGPIEVGRDYNCGYNALISLKGAPKHIKDDFWCNDNQLSSLEGGPIKVDGYYGCSRNMLKSLIGCARIINGCLLAHNNKHLTSLEGGPNYVGQNAYFTGCEKLSLQNIHVYLPEVHSVFYFDTLSSCAGLLGLLRVKGLLRVSGLHDNKLQAILNRYLPEGDIFRCALELVEAGYKECATI
jgi:hypothetical protein